MHDSIFHNTGWQATYAFVLAKLCNVINGLNYGILGNIITLMTLVIVSLAFVSRVSRSYRSLKRKIRLRNMRKKGGDK